MQHLYMTTLIMRKHNHQVARIRGQLSLTIIPFVEHEQSSVLALEDSVLDVDQVDNLIKFCPTKEEVELLKVNSSAFELIYLFNRYAL